MKRGYITAIASIVALAAVFLPAAAVRAEEGPLDRFAVTVGEKACACGEGDNAQAELVNSCFVFPADCGEKVGIFVLVGQKSLIYLDKRI